MRRFLLVLALVCGGASAAQAQIVQRPSYPPVGTFSPFLPDSSLPAPSVRQDLRQIRGRIDDAREAGLLSRREARALRREAAFIAGLARRYGRDGLSRPESSELATRTAALRASLNAR